MPIETKAAQAYRVLRGRILSGEWPHDSALPAERQLLEELGISRSTLRYALGRLVSDGFVRSVPGSGSYVTYRGEARFVALLAHEANLVSPLGTFYHRLADEFRSLTRAAGYLPQSIVGQGSTAAEFSESLAHVGAATLAHTVGVISITPPLRFADICLERGIPLVGWNAPYEATPHSAGTVRYDWEALLSMARQLLRARGWPGYVVMLASHQERPVKDHDAQGGAREWRDIMALVGGDSSRVVLVPWTLDYRHAHTVFKQWWERASKPATIFFPEDAVCKVVLGAVLELGIRVPEELSILTHSNTSSSWQFPVELTRLECDEREAMRQCWALLQAAWEGHAPPDQPVSIPPRLVEGNSLPGVEGARRLAGRSGTRTSATSPAARE